MFCSALRRRREWAPILSALSRSDAGWRGDQLSQISQKTADPLSRDKARKSRHCLPYSTKQCLQSHAHISHRSWNRADKSEDRETAPPQRWHPHSNHPPTQWRRRHNSSDKFADGVRQTLISIPHFQYLTKNRALHYGDVPIIPISSATDLPSCLTSLRKQCNELPSVNPSTSKQALVPYCANGQPLSERQANILTDIANGFRDLATNAFVPQSQRLICDFLGDRDGARVVSFFTGGPRPSTC